MTAAKAIFRLSSGPSALKTNEKNSPKFLILVPLDPVCTASVVIRNCQQQIRQPPTLPAYLKKLGTMSTKSIFTIVIPGKIMA
jgi:hypothetical protein